MRVAILSCGPSLALFPGSDRYLYTIGVNSAVEAFPCDIWCASDHNIFCDYTPAEPFPWGVFTSGPIKPYFMEMDPVTEGLTRRTIPAAVYERLVAARTWNKGDYEFNGFSGFGNRSVNIWKRFTIASALMLAYMMGATDIDVYGHDAVGENDWKGEPGRRPSDRSETRWEHEKETWDLVCGWIQDRGVNITRNVECPTAASR